MTQRSKQLTFFTHPLPHARHSDPPSSDAHVKSIGRDDSLKAQVIRSAVACARREEHRVSADGYAIAVTYDRPVTDDAVVAHMERRLGRRFQRNVIARTRGLLEPIWFERVPPVIGPTGRPIVAYVPTEAAVRFVNSTPAVH